MNEYTVEELKQKLRDKDLESLRRDMDKVIDRQNHYDTLEVERSKHDTIVDCQLKQIIEQIKTVHMSIADVKSSVKEMTNDNNLSIVGFLKNNIASIIIAVYLVAEKIIK